MRLVLAFGGSRGDVQPGLALARALQGRGHRVSMAVPPNLVAFARSADLDARPCGPDTAELLSSSLTTRDIKSRNPISRARAAAAVTLAGSRRAQADLVRMSDGADAIVGGSVGQERASGVAEALAVPYVPVHYCPVRPTSTTSLFAPFGRDLPGPLARASWHIVEQALWWSGRGGENRLRVDLGLAPAHRPTARRVVARGVPEIQAYDAALFPGLAREWGPRRPLVGFLGVDRTTRAMLERDDGNGADDGGLTSWLADGPPPVYVGFGSMTVADPVGLADAVARATVGRRVLIASGWSEVMATAARRVAAGDERIRVERAVDHETVLPQCAVVVHHGGAGSVAAGLRAGRPTVICALGADQPMWGRAVRRAGVGVWMPMADVSTVALRSALADATSAPTVRTARELGAALAPADDAAQAACEVIEGAVERRAPRPR